MRQVWVARDTSVRRDDVESAEFGDGRVDAVRQGLGVTDINFDGDDATTQLLNEQGGLGEFLGGPCRVPDVDDVVGNVDRDDVGALFGQANRMCTPLTACRPPGDQATLPSTRPTMTPLLVQLMCRVTHHPCGGRVGVVAFRDSAAGVLDCDIVQPEKGGVYFYVTG